MTDTDTIRGRLEAMRDELTALSQESEEARRPVALDQQSVGRLSRMDAMQAQAMARAAEDRRAREIARIGAALQRLEDGTWGMCLSCEEDIDPRRLEVDPAATLCTRCASQSG